MMVFKFYILLCLLMVKLININFTSIFLTLPRENARFSQSSNVTFHGSSSLNCSWNAVTTACAPILLLLTALQLDNCLYWPYLQHN
jgi:hypothetical protein